MVRTSQLDSLRARRNRTLIKPQGRSLARSVGTQSGSHFLLRPELTRAPRPTVRAWGRSYQGARDRARGSVVAHEQINERLAFDHDPLANGRWLENTKRPLLLGPRHEHPLA